jgi:hypothetical protein
MRVSLPHLSQIRRGVNFRYQPVGERQGIDVYEEW